MQFCMRDHQVFPVPLTALTREIFVSSHLTGGMLSVSEFQTRPTFFIKLKSEGAITLRFARSWRAPIAQCSIKIFGVRVRCGVWESEFFLSFTFHMREEIIDIIVHTLSRSQFCPQNRKSLSQPRFCRLSALLDLEY